MNTFRRIVHSRQARFLFIRIKTTPNEHSRRFELPHGVVFQGVRGEMRDYPAANLAYSSPLAMFVFRIGGVRAVLVGETSLTVTKDYTAYWDVLGPSVCEAVTAFHQTGDDAVLGGDNESHDPYPDTRPSPSDSENVQAIKELLAGEVRPMVQEDGGDIRFVGFDDESGAVLVTLQGACATCNSSSNTLREAVERALKHWLPEVTQVVRVTSDFAEEFKRAGCLVATGKSIEELVEEMDSAAEQQQQQQQSSLPEGDEDLKWKVKGGAGGACSR
ncbi:NFU1 iron-sulfur cluster scaffold-like protein [Diplonema papillatum]|nr:NFU1 iron-sulfur cluster scaffold-like protein [Diplonema papillatum]